MEFSLKLDDITKGKKKKNTRKTLGHFDTSERGLRSQELAKQLKEQTS